MILDLSSINRIEKREQRTCQVARQDRDECVLNLAQNLFFNNDFIAYFYKEPKKGSTNFVLPFFYASNHVFFRLQQKNHSNKIGMVEFTHYRRFKYISSLVTMMIWVKYIFVRFWNVWKVLFIKVQYLLVSGRRTA